MDFPKIFGAAPFTSEEKARIGAELNEHGYGDRIAEANRLFGYNGWSQCITSLDVRFVEDQGEKNGWCACVSASVKVTLKDGCSREDRGGAVCTGMASRGAALLRAEQEAVEDAVRRALKNFGLSLGLGKR